MFKEPIEGHWSTEEGTEIANRYVLKKRSDLRLGKMSDLEIANAVYMADRNSRDLFMLQTAAKERIRWLSAQLAAANSKLANK